MTVFTFFHSICDIAAQSEGFALSRVSITVMQSLIAEVIVFTVYVLSCTVTKGEKNVCRRIGFAKWAFLQLSCCCHQQLSPPGLGTCGGKHKQPKQVNVTYRVATVDK